jgi:hypothetical protein
MLIYFKAAFPWKLNTAGPVIKTLLSVSLFHSMNKSPPGSATLTLFPEGIFPARMAATVNAHAPVPHARVGPAPRSQTTIKEV